MWFECRDVHTRGTSWIREDDLRDELEIYYGQYHPHQKWALEQTDVAIDALECGQVFYTDYAEYRRADPD